MATIPLKDITFPGLDNTYTIPEIDNTLSTAGKAADAKKTGDEIDQLKSDLTATKANLNSSINDIGGTIRASGTTISGSSDVQTILTPINLSAGILYTVRFACTQLTDAIYIRIKDGSGTTFKTLNLYSGDTTGSLSFYVSEDVENAYIGVQTPSQAVTYTVSLSSDTFNSMKDRVDLMCEDVSASVVSGTAVKINLPDSNPYVSVTNDAILIDARSEWSSVVVPCNSGDQFIVSGTGGSGNYRLWAFVGALDTTRADVLSVCDTTTSSNGVTSLNITAPIGAKYAVFNFKSSSANKTVYHIANTALTDVYEDVTELKESSNHIRFMVFGNSYGCDSISYVPFILKNMGITCDIYLYRRDGCSLRDIYNRWESSADTDTESDGIHAGTYYRSLFHIDTRTDTAWETLTTISMKDCVALGDWDFITLQQWSAYSIDESTYEPWLSLVIDRIRQVIDKPTKIAWTGVCTRATADNPQAGLSAMQNAVYKVQPVDFLIPYGTAIFNARTNNALAEIGDYTNHNLWCSDGIHLQDGLPRYIAALAVVEAICKEFFPTKCVLYDKTRPTTETMTTWNVLQRHMPVVGITEANCLLAQKSAILANNFPFTITQVDDLPYLEYSSLSGFPVTGESGILYCDTSTGYTYTWDGSAYVQNIAN